MPASVGPSEIERAAALSEDASEELCALALEALSQQAEARTLFSGADFVEKKREAHGVDADVEVGGVRVVDVLTKGPTTGIDYALLAALMVRGVQAHLDDAMRLRRFARHADWFALATPYPTHELIDPVLGDDAGPLWVAIAEGADSEEGSPRSEAISALRRGALRRSTHDAAKEQLEASGDDSSEHAVLAGVLESGRPRGFVGLLRLLSGFAALEWLVRGLAYVLGTKRRATVRIERKGLALTSSWQLLGREVRNREESIAFASLASFARTQRFAIAPMLLGALMFAVGIVVGGLWLFDGVRSGETFLLGVGAALILVGGGLDYAVSTLMPSLAGRVEVELELMPKRRLRVVSVAPEDAARFVRSLKQASGT